MTTLAEILATEPAPGRATMPPCGHVPRPYDGPSREEILAMRRQYASPALFTLYREPLPAAEFP